MITTIQKRKGQREKQTISFADVEFKGFKHDTGVNVPIARLERILRKQGIQIITHGMPNNAQLSAQEALSLVDTNRENKLVTTATYLPTGEILYTTLRGKVSFEVKQAQKGPSPAPTAMQPGLVTTPQTQILPQTSLIPRDIP